MYNVLVVDDEPAIFEILSLMIDWKLYGFNISKGVYNGRDALKHFSGHRINLIITDIRMPVMDGMELIRNIRSEGFTTKIIILSGYNEFEYAKKAIEYGVVGFLLKPINKEELIELLTQVKTDLDNEFNKKSFYRKYVDIAKDRSIYDFVNGQLSLKELMSHVDSFPISLSGASYAVALVQIENFFNLIEENLEDAKLYKFAVRNILEEIIGDKSIGFVYEENEGMLGVLLTSEKTSLEVPIIEETLEYFAQCVLTYLNFKVTVIYGNIVNTVKDLKLSRKQALLAIDRKFSTYGKNVISYNSVEIDTSQLWEINWDSTTLISAVENIDCVTIETEINKLSKEIGSKLFSHDILNSLVHNMVFSLCSIVRKYNGDPATIFHQAEIESLIRNVTDINEIAAWMLSICVKASNYVYELLSSKSSRVIDQIKKYIDENLPEDLTLKKISTVFYLNSAYLGQLFKNTTNESFNDYINKKRILEVKSSLVSENYKMHELLKKVGFNSPEHFYRQFKRYEGISFAEYNKSFKDNKRG